MLLETIHLQGAALNGEFGVVQWNQPTIAIIEAPAQQVPYLTRQMATRTRTRRVEGTRHETVNLREFDIYATNAKFKNEEFGEDGRYDVA